MSDIQSGFGDISGAVSDIFGAVGSEQAASAYDRAGDIAIQNEALTLRSTAIQQQQLQRSVFQAEGTETAETAGAGFNVNSGSAGDLMRSSAQQAALSGQLVQSQGEITAQGYAQQANSYYGQATAAKTAAVGKGVGGALSLAFAGFSFSVICTELYDQHKMPSHWWLHSMKAFQKYPAAVKEGYYLWSTPTVRHMRKYPEGLLSRFMETIFLWRSENIAAHSGVKSARKLWRGAAVTAFLWPICYALGYVRLRLNSITEWGALYGR